MHEQAIEAEKRDVRIEQLARAFKITYDKLREGVVSKGQKLYDDGQVESVEAGMDKMIDLLQSGVIRPVVLTADEKRKKFVTSNGVDFNSAAMLASLAQVRPGTHQKARKLRRSKAIAAAKGIELSEEATMKKDFPVRSAEERRKLRKHRESVLKRLKSRK